MEKEKIFLWYHSAFWQVIILATLLDDIIIDKWKKYTENNEAIKKDCFQKIILKSKMSEKDYNLMKSLVDLRNNLAHDCIKEPEYSRLFSWNVIINNLYYDNILDYDNIIFLSDNSVQDYKKKFRDLCYEKLENYLPDNDRLKHYMSKKQIEWKLFFPILFFYIIWVVKDINF